MSDIAINVENLGKLYRIGQLEPYKTIREVVTNAAAAPFRMAASAFRRQQSVAETPPHNTIWALKDASFQIKQGEAIGVIGRNGSGKTTLLKLLSRITVPTEGYAEIRGRVGSLLEVGTGFHPELTGRENIYLNGAVLGMKRSQIERKFDAIVDFAGVEEFIDTPLKRYSSGMQVRLAFSVAAHMEPEILLVDEVLAVGDTMFQKKCMGKMGEVSRGGRTIFFVSHSMQAVSTLCERAILLDAGRIVMDGPTQQVIESYLRDIAGGKTEVVWSLEDAPGTDTARVHAVRILNSRGVVSHSYDSAEPITLEIEFWVLQAKGEVHPTFYIYNAQGVRLFGTASSQDPDEGKRYVREPGLYRCSCTIPGNFLNQGQHYLSAFLFLNKTLLQADLGQVVSFSVDDMGRDIHMGIGAVRPLLPWKLQRIKER